MAALLLDRNALGKHMPSRTISSYHTKTHVFLLLFNISSSRERKISVIVISMLFIFFLLLN